MIQIKAALAGLADNPRAPEMGSKRFPAAGLAFVGRLRKA